MSSEHFRSTSATKLIVSTFALLVVLLLALTLGPKLFKPRVDAPQIAATVLDADEFVLLSIDGTDGYSDRYAPDAPRFYHWPLLGKVAIDGVSDRRRIVDALNAAMADPPQREFACFYPRHALRVVKGDQIAEYFICFECRNMNYYEGEKSFHARLSGTPAKVLNEILSSAGIPLAPPSEFE